MFVTSRPHHTTIESGFPVREPSVVFTIFDNNYGTDRDHSEWDQI